MPRLGVSVFGDSRCLVLRFSEKEGSSLAFTAGASRRKVQKRQLNAAASFGPEALAFHRQSTGGLSARLLRLRRRFRSAFPLQRGRNSEGEEEEAIISECEEGDSEGDDDCWDRSEGEAGLCYSAVSGRAFFLNKDETPPPNESILPPSRAKRAGRRLKTLRKQLSDGLRNVAPSKGWPGGHSSAATAAATTTTSGAKHRRSVHSARAEAATPPDVGEEAPPPGCQPCRRQIAAVAHGTTFGRSGAETPSRSKEPSVRRQEGREASEATDSGSVMSSASGEGTVRRSSSRRRQYHRGSQSAPERYGRSSKWRQDIHSARISRRIDRTEVKVLYCSEPREYHFNSPYQLYRFPDDGDRRLLLQEGKSRVLE